MPVDWEGTTSGFQLTVAAGAAVTLGYDNEGAAPPFLPQAAILASLCWVIRAALQPIAAARVSH